MNHRYRLFCRFLPQVILLVALVGCPTTTPDPDPNRDPSPDPAAAEFQVPLVLPSGAAPEALISALLNGDA